MAESVRTLSREVSGNTETAITLEAERELAPV
jgi:hypothetical protein